MQSLGDDVVAAKINQASAVNFKLEVDDLSKLKSAGVSQNVISAMLRRSSMPSMAGGAPGQYPGPGGAPGYADFNRVKLLTKDNGSFNLRAIGGSMSSTFAYVTSLRYANFPGLKADVRIHDGKPTLLIRYPNNPKGHYYLVSAESDSKNGVRSVKMGNSHFFGASNLGALDSDNQIPYDAVAEGQDGWRITPTKDLRPGEYGLWQSMMQMYDFGVDP